MITNSESSAVPEKLVEQIKSARRRARLSQEELALLAGISRRPIYLLESGKGTIRLDNLIRILDALGLEIELRPKGAKRA